MAVVQSEFESVKLYSGNENCYMPWLTTFSSVRPGIACRQHGHFHFHSYIPGRWRMKWLTEFIPAAMTCCMRRGKRRHVSTIATWWRESIATHHHRYSCLYVAWVSGSQCLPFRSKFFEDQYAPPSLTMPSKNIITYTYVLVCPSYYKC
jgi:hypothetical protein